jgi:hypothetical protein
MAVPTLESRRRRRVLIMSASAQMGQALRVALPEGWECVESLDLEEIGGFEDVLQLRFIVIDLDPLGVWDPVDAVAQVRSELMLNVPILCFGSDKAQHDRARMAGADRFFNPAEIVEALPEFCGQLGW